MRSRNQTTIATFCENSKDVSSDFSMMKSIVALSFLLSFPMKLIYCFKSGFLIQFACLNLLQLICNVLKSTHNLINYLSFNRCFFPCR